MGGFLPLADPLGKPEAYPTVAGKLEAYPTATNKPRPILEHHKHHMSYSTFHYEVTDSVARITFCRPQEANTMTPTFAKELKEVASVCRDDADVRAILFTAEGKVFCAGGDLKTFAEQGDQLPQALEAMIVDLHAGIEIFSSIDAPTIAAVGGAAGGAGLSLVTMCSLAYAGESAKFVAAYTGAGLSPDGSMSYFLPRAIGVRRAQELMLTNRTLSAQEAVDWGLINEAVPDADVVSTAEKMAKRLAAGPTKAFGVVRKLLTTTLQNRLHDQLQLEGEGIVGMSRTADGREGISAFVEKRRPNFSGR